MKANTSVAPPPQKETAKSEPAALFKELGSSPGGLSSAEAKKRLEQHLWLLELVREPLHTPKL